MEAKNKFHLESFLYFLMNDNNMIFQRQKMLLLQLIGICLPSMHVISYLCVSFWVAGLGLGQFKVLELWFHKFCLRSALKANKNQSSCKALVAEFSFLHPLSGCLKGINEA